MKPGMSLTKHFLQFKDFRAEEYAYLFERASMSDEDLVAYYEHATLKPRQPRASIETPLHSMLPFAHIDHTHPDAIIALCAIPSGPDLARQLWGDRALWVPYQRPGFGLDDPHRHGKACRTAAARRGPRDPTGGNGARRPSEGRRAAGRPDRRSRLARRRPGGDRR